MTYQGSEITLYCSISQDMSFTLFINVATFSNGSLSVSHTSKLSSSLPFHFVTPGAVKTLTMHTVVSQTSHMSGATGTSYTLTKQGHSTFKRLALILSM